MQRVRYFASCSFAVLILLSGFPTCLPCSNTIMCLEREKSHSQRMLPSQEALMVLKWFVQASSFFFFGLLLHPTRTASDLLHSVTPLRRASTREHKSRSRTSTISQKQKTAAPLVPQASAHRTSHQSLSSKRFPHRSRRILRFCGSCLRSCNRLCLASPAENGLLSFELFSLITQTVRHINKR